MVLCSAGVFRIWPKESRVLIGTRLSSKTFLLMYFNESFESGLSVFSCSTKLLWHNYSTYLPHLLAGWSTSVLYNLYCIHHTYYLVTVRSHSIDFIGPYIRFFSAVAYVCRSVFTSVARFFSGRAGYWNCLEINAGFFRRKRDILKQDGQVQARLAP